MGGLGPGYSAENSGERGYFGFSINVAEIAPRECGAYFGLPLNTIPKLPRVTLFDPGMTDGAGRTLVGNQSNWNTRMAILGLTIPIYAAAESQLESCSRWSRRAEMKDAGLCLPKTDTFSTRFVNWPPPRKLWNLFPFL